MCVVLRSHLYSTIYTKGHCTSSKLTWIGGRSGSHYRSHYNNDQPTMQAQYSVSSKQPCSGASYLTVVNFFYFCEKLRYLSTKTVPAVFGIFTFHSLCNCFYIISSLSLACVCTSDNIALPSRENRFFQSCEELDKVNCASSSLYRWDDFGGQLLVEIV